MTGTCMQRQAVIMYHGGKIFVGLIFMVEGTHENFNTTKISTYTICLSICTCTCTGYSVKEIFKNMLFVACR